MIRYDGNILHTALYWNSGKKGWDFFNLFVEQGALFIQDSYDEYPWEQIGTKWFDPLTQEDLGNRDYREFEELYNEIKQKVYEILNI